MTGRAAQSPRKRGDGHADVGERVVGGLLIGMPPAPHASSPRTITLIPGRSTAAPTPAVVMNWLGRALPILVGSRRVLFTMHPWSVWAGVV